MQLELVVMCFKIKVNQHVYMSDSDTRKNTNINIFSEA